MITQKLSKNFYKFLKMVTFAIHFMIYVIYKSSNIKSYIHIFASIYIINKIHIFSTLDKAFISIIKNDTILYPINKNDTIIYQLIPWYILSHDVYSSLATIFVKSWSGKVPMCCIQYNLWIVSHDLVMWIYKSHIN